MTDEDLRRLFEETRRHFDVVAERIERRLDGSAETLGAFDEKFDRRIDPPGLR